MARISIYPLDTVISRQDKVIGTDSNNSVTKNFPLEGLGNFFSVQSTVAGQIGYKFAENLGDGTLTGPTDATPFSDLTTFKLSEIDGAGHNIENFLQEYLDTRILIAQVDNKNNYAVYNVTGIVEDENNPNYYDFSLTFVSGNGSLILDKYYVIAFKDGDLTYTHSQNLASETWVINHNLNKFPSVSIKFSGSPQLYSNVGAFAGVTYTNKNSLTINLSAAQSGVAYLN